MDSRGLILSAGSDDHGDRRGTRHIAEITSESKSAYVQALNKGESLSVALAAADLAAAEAIDALVGDAGAILTSGYINNGRAVVFDKNADDVHALQRSEILDASTCNYCLSIDGRVFEKDDAQFANLGPVHSNCRNRFRIIHGNLLGPAGARRGP